MNTIAPLALAAFLLSGLTTPVAALATDDGLTDFAPRLQRVVSRDRVYFLKDPALKKGCPADTEPCRERAYLLPGDLVVVTGVSGEYAQADYIGGRPGRYRETAGWLPRSALADEPETGKADWTGTWTAGGDPTPPSAIDDGTRGGVYIAITAASGKLEVSGNGNRLLPGPRAKSQPHWGQLEATLADTGNVLTFSPSLDGAAVQDPAPGPDTCRVRMWRLGPYLLVQYTYECVDLFNSVGFAGLYRRIDR